MNEKQVSEKDLKEENLLIFTDKIAGSSEAEGFIEDYLIMIPMETMRTFLRAEDPADTCSLYLFYCYTAKWQKTNQPRATDGFARKGLNMGRTRIERAQKFLIENKFIEKIVRRDALSGMITGWYMKVNYRFQGNLYSKAVKEAALLDLDVDAKGMSDQFKMLKAKGEYERIFERDKWTCVYCESKVESLKHLYDKGIDRKEIARYVSKNTRKIATIDHIIPLSLGGDNSDENLATACVHCNCKKKNSLLSENEQVGVLPVACLSTSGKTATNALSNININASISKQTSPEYLSLANLLKTEILKNEAGAVITEAQVKKWADVVRLMIERDKRDAVQIRDVILWAQGNDFWRINILSMGTLRDKFTRLVMQMKPKEKNSTLSRERSLQYDVRKKPANI